MRRIFFCWLLAVMGAVESLHAQGTAFTYQGWLNAGGSLANSNFDLTFTLYTATNLPGTVVAGPVTNSAVPVTNGQFMVTLDFGAGVFTGPDRWLEIAVRATGTTNFTTLAPRQRVTPVPYAIFANSASNLAGTLASTQLVGTLPASAFAGYTNTVALTNGANLFSGAFSGTFAGNGTNLVNLNASQLTGGTVADARQSTNVALLNRSQVFGGTNVFTGPNSFSGSNVFSGANTFSGANFFSGSNTFTNRGNSFIGSFFGNGLVGWIVVSGISTQAMSDAGYLLTSAQLTTVTLPASASNGDIVRISGAGAGGWQVALNFGQSVLGNFSGYANSYWSLSSASQNKWSAIASSANGLKLVAVVVNGGIFTSPDGGNTWNATSAGSLQWRSVASSADGNRLVAVVNNGGIYTSTNSGGAWAAQTSGLPATALWTGVASSADGTHLVAVINGDYIYTSANSGLSWVRQTSGLPAGGTWTTVTSSSDGTKLAAVEGSTGIIYLSSNSGASWSSPGNFGVNVPAVASSADGSKIVVVKNPGGISTSADSGANWTAQTGAPTSSAWNAVASSADGGKLAAAVTGGAIYLSSNFGATWSQQTNATIQAWNDLSMSADGTRLAAVVNALTGGIYIGQAAAQTTSTTSTGYLSGGQGTAVELQYIGNNQWMPVSVSGTIWAY